MKVSGASKETFFSEMKVAGAKSNLFFKMKVCTAGNKGCFSENKVAGPKSNLFFQNEGFGEPEATFFLKMKVVGS